MALRLTPGKTFKDSPDNSGGETTSQVESSIAADSAASFSYQGPGALNVTLNDGSYEFNGGQASATQLLNSSSALQQTNTAASAAVSSSAAAAAAVAAANAQSIQVPTRKYSTARLYSLSSASHSGIVNGQSAQLSSVFIEFPAMPETIELAREVNYHNVAAVAPTPDGIFVYGNTEPMEIPISFKLHAFDTEYCTGGPFTLLLLAARLHAFAAPIGENSQRASSAPPTNIQAISTSEDSLLASVTSTVAATVGNLSSDGTPYWPPVAVLDLMQAGNLGIVCRGFVKAPKVILGGPFLNPGNKNPYARNLPTWAEYSFTFVHSPGYTNAPVSPDDQLNVGIVGQAYAPDILRNFYSDISMASPPVIGMNEASVGSTT